MTIKEVSERTGVSIDNLRYYERIGIIPHIPRNKSGIRNYDERAIHWIEFILKFKQAGASLEAIIEYIGLLNSDDESKEARRNILFEIRDDINNRINKLSSCLEMIEYKIDNFDNLCDPITQEMIKNWKLDKEKR